MVNPGSGEGHINFTIYKAVQIPLRLNWVSLFFFVKAVPGFELSDLLLLGRPSTTYATPPVLC
jgi:hypothetical protein